ncbi:MAG: GIY-YIG nuclease family protein [Armatimonadetes bacterium]|nr:GIY-YIG nuclease family protein [Armatimonadota bacterium]MBI2973189.1 GIY-YIG nuclease family protein [Armatimonadota bacterium]
MFYVYFLSTASNQLYVGCTRDPWTRLRWHSLGHGAYYLLGEAKFRIVYHEKYNSLKQARRREKQLKRWTRAKKEALIRGDLVALKRLSRRRKSARLE